MAAKEVWEKKVRWTAAFELPEVQIAEIDPCRLGAVIAGDRQR